MPVPPDAAYTTLAPDWVCEVLSPSTRKLDLGGKSAVYARAGVSHMWLVDPIAPSLEARELRGTKWMEIATLYDDATVSLPPFGRSVSILAVCGCRELFTRRLRANWQLNQSPHQLQRPSKFVAQAAA